MNYVNNTTFWLNDTLYPTHYEPIDSILPAIDEPVIYFAINCHGNIRFSNENDPEYINIPSELSVFNKITYAPVGLSNIYSSMNANYIITTLKKTIKKIYDNGHGYSINLVNYLKSLKLIDPPKKSLLNESDIKTRVSLHSLQKNIDHMYQSVLYNAENHPNIINKTYGIKTKSILDRLDNYLSNFNIYVVFEKSDNTIYNKLEIGTTIIGNNHYNTYKQNIDIDIDIDIENNIKINHKKQQQITTITTEELLNYAVYCGYKSVVILDFTCDVCIDTTTNKKIARNKVISLRNSISSTSKIIGRGIKTNMTQQIKFKKSKKSKKSKKTQ